MVLQKGVHFPRFLNRKLQHLQYYYGSIFMLFSVNWKIYSQLSERSWSSHAASWSVRLFFYGSSDAYLLSRMKLFWSIPQPKIWKLPAEIIEHGCFIVLQYNTYARVLSGSMQWDSCGVGYCLIHSVINRVKQWLATKFLPNRYEGASLKN